MGAAAVLAVMLLASGAAGAEEYVTTGDVEVSPEEYATFTSPPTYRAYLPEAVDLSPYFPPVGSQGGQGSCGPWAVGYAARAYYAGVMESRPVSSPSNIPSPAYLYSIVGTSGSDCKGGTKVPDLLRVLQGGALSLSDMPYDATVCPVVSQAARSAATDFRIKGFDAIYPVSVEETKGQLALGNPVILSLSSNQALEDLSYNVWEAERRPATEKREGHAVTLVGYDERSETFKFINSWGTDWGRQGYGVMSYRTFLNRVDGAYVIRMPEGRVPPPPPPPPAPEPEPPPSPEPVPPPEPVVPPPGPTPILSGLSCGKVELVQRQDKVFAVGFVQTSEDLSTLRQQLGPDVSLEEVQQRPWPQCEALLTLDAQMEEGVDRPLVEMAATDLTAGDPMVFKVTAPSFGGYVHVAYFNAIGEVTNLAQVTPDSIETASPNEVATFGESPKFSVSAPFGDEMILVIASKSPLFAQPRETVETEREFLSGLRRAILSRGTEGEDRVVSAAYLPLRTRDRSAN